MKYHFKFHPEEPGGWAECCELDGCQTEGDSMNELLANCKEALECYILNADDTIRNVPLPNKTLDAVPGLLHVPVPPRIAIALRTPCQRISA